MKRFQEKWLPVFRQKTRPNKLQERFSETLRPLIAVAAAEIKASGFNAGLRGSSHIIVMAGPSP